MSLLDTEDVLLEQAKYPKFFKSPIEVKWNITGQCGCDCKLCYRTDYSKSTKKDISDKDLIHIAREIVENEVMSVTFSGGEPLLKREQLREIIPMLSNENIAITIETNGLELTKEDIEFFGEHGVNVSIGIHLGRDSDRSDNRIINILKSLKGRVPDIKVNYLLDRGSVGYLGNTIDMIASVGGISEVQVHTVAIRGRALEANIKDHKLSLDDYNEAMSITNLKNDQYGKKPLCTFKDHAFDLHKFLTMETSNYYAVIDNDGSVKACEWLPVSFGNILEERLEDIWDWGLNGCWSDYRMKFFLKDIKNINKLGGDIEKRGDDEIDFFSL